MMKLDRRKIKFLRLYFLFLKGLQIYNKVVKERKSPKVQNCHILQSQSSPKILLAHNSTTGGVEHFSAICWWFSFKILQTFFSCLIFDSHGIHG